MYKLLPLLFILMSFQLIAQNREIKAVQLYSQDELIRLINRNEHLSRVVLDDCQLVQDIEARAQTLKIPAYQFLWGDMLAWGVCVETDAERGIYYMNLAAEQGLAAAFEQLGRYYRDGKFVQVDSEKAVSYFYESSYLGNQKGQIQLAEMFVDGFGSPYDYEDAYHWLYNSITADKETHDRIEVCLDGLERLMSPKSVRNAKRPLDS
jgi:TPR repeat protein